MQWLRPHLHQNTSHQSQNPLRCVMCTPRRQDGYFYVFGHAKSDALPAFVQQHRVIRRRSGGLMAGFIRPKDHLLGEANAATVQGAIPP